MPKAAGILDIAVGVLFVLIILVFLRLADFWLFFWLALPSIVGGVYSLNRKVWTLALTGSVSASLSLLAFSFTPTGVFHPSGLFLVPVGFIAVLFTMLSKKEFELEIVPDSRNRRGWFNILSGMFITFSGILQTGMALYIIWPLIFGETTIGNVRLPGTQINPFTFSIALIVLITGITNVIIGSISIVHPEKWNLAVFGSILAVIPLGVIANFIEVPNQAVLLISAVSVLVALGAFSFTAVSKFRA